MRATLLSIVSFLIATLPPAVAGGYREDLSCVQASSTVADPSFQIFTSQVKRINSCLPFPMKPGDAREISRSYTESVTGIEQQYALSRLSENIFQVELNLRFWNDQFFGSSELNRRMEQKTKACLDEINPLIKGPRGESIAFKLTSAAAIIEIKVKTDHEPRPISREWPETIDCATLFHEVLHLVGLPDEYNDKDGYKGRFSRCRIEGAPFSVMNQPVVAHQLAKEGFLPSILMPHQFYAILAGDCIEGESTYAKCARRALADAGQQADCPAGELIVKQCREILDSDFTAEFKKLFLTRSTEDGHGKLRKIMTENLSPEAGVEFFLSFLKNPDQHSSEHFEQSIMGIRAMLKSAAAVKNAVLPEALVDRLIKVLVARLRIDKSFGLRSEDILITLMKDKKAAARQPVLKEIAEISPAVAQAIQKSL